MTPTATAAVAKAVTVFIERGETINHLQWPDAAVLIGVCLVACVVFLKL